MRVLALACLFGSLTFAQSLRGILIERDSGPSGEFAVRAPDYHVHRFRFDSKTSVDRNHDAIDVPRLRLKGDLSFSGVIVKVDGSRLVLRTRTGDEQTIVLRQDTRDLDNGEIVAMASLKPTMRVFVRGSRNLYGDVEGYQVAWGNILEVH